MGAAGCRATGAPGGGIVSVIEVFAPGKLFVIGEYAVLHGARALVAALDAGIRCRVEPAPGWWLSAPDLGVEGRMDDVVPEPAGRLLASAIDVGRREFAVGTPLAVRVGGVRFASSDKRGLGGSAASVVAILGALAAAAGHDLEARETRERLFASGLAVHRAHQRGRGSGADVAASVYGGWLDYSLGEGGAQIARATLPPQTRLAAVWSGVPSDTARAIEAFEAPSTLSRLRAILERFWIALGAEQRAAMRREIDAYGAVLEEMGGGEGGARRIAELAAAARQRGWAAKGSGAVGGDCAIALAFDAADAAALEEEWRRRNAEPLAVSIDTRGVRCEEAHA